jgi:hypothetical protein
VAICGKKGFGMYYSGPNLKPEIEWQKLRNRIQKHHKSIVTQAARLPTLYDDWKALLSGF